MELLTYKDENKEYTYYLDENGHVVPHGERKEYCSNGQRRGLLFSYHGKWHGEYKVWDRNGELLRHLLYINNNTHPYVEMTEQEKLLFQIKYPGFRFIED